MGKPNIEKELHTINVSIRELSNIVTDYVSSATGEHKEQQTSQWIQDDKYGWSKVKYKGKEYYIVNSHLSRKGLSSYPKEILKKDTKVYVEKKGRLIKAKILKKGTKVNVLCTVIKGRYKGYDYLGKGKSRYYRK